MKCVTIVVILHSLLEISCWKYFTSLSDLTLTGSDKDFDVMHSEYTFGNCQEGNIKFFVHVHKDHMDVLGKLIIREWLNIRRIPTCIVLRATSFEIDMFRSTAYAFQICIPRITYCHSQKRFKYFYYEWYIPKEMIGGMNWDIYFYGPEGVVYQ
ncbi:uncharacterized protein LOC116777359 [Danaus plexippus]|uniref:uncharacterized protein LOC116777359 n=1 Tax=Danaus plexippus TaxID=13037 RepID=UPI0013C476D1|nr:uncharacterized protein LOC116777359 [Danaus plexippus]